MAYGFRIYFCLRKCLDCRALSSDGPQDSDPPTPLTPRRKTREDARHRRAASSRARRNRVHLGSKCNALKDISQKKSNRYRVKSHQARPRDYRETKANVLKDTCPQSAIVRGQPVESRLLYDRKEAARRFLTPVEASEFLGGLNSRTVTRWAREGYLPAFPVGEGKRRLWRFLESDLEAWMRARRTGCLPAHFDEDGATLASAADAPGGFVR
jgi:excisionase family DNA binding protein